jgi:hypothetical protein
MFKKLIIANSFITLIFQGNQPNLVDNPEDGQVYIQSYTLFKPKSSLSNEKPPELISEGKYEGKYYKRFHHCRYWEVVKEIMFPRVGVGIG